MPMTLADRLTALILLALGVALLIGGYTMDRLEIRQIHPASIPGLVPMLLGGLLMLCSLLLLLSSYDGSESSAEEGVFVGGSWVRLGLTGVLCIAYALGLVGWLSFFWATAVFIFSFALIFSYPLSGVRKQQMLSVVSALALGLVTAFGLSLLFSEVFLVRLP